MSVNRKCAVSNFLAADSKLFSKKFLHILLHEPETLVFQKSHAVAQTADICSPSHYSTWISASQRFMSSPLKLLQQLLLLCG